MPSGVYERKPRKSKNHINTINPSVDLKSHADEQDTIFGVGDLVSAQNGVMKVILEVTSKDYKFMQLKDEYIKTTSGTIHLKKGDITTQPQSVFNKYHYLYQP